ncbi:tetrapyrrole biosynthesis uroporphyrinogen III synthase [Laetiporus sulphureus 93-53]|uniref:Tetrapyrrole biosynthesis uroporphyrinogen III synthase n=1 Tax=Laetiporus sulphureus 93-53 TaxID=1314785 RepID=A0A165B6P9_9APHY|nr:tetrapyrrole biosynthesis uroporphyrinogen III synthase [Laetiporus sulphureus 93-53]KZT00365.1 tetrapyrrole biosynthesis uroporphyrinogen III synthase [Laetiporus sulphureus 93-53]
MSNVLLLRSPGAAADLPDRYESAFQSRGYHPVSVPVLETAYVNLHELKDIVVRGPGKQGHDGVVITSGRSAEAWKIVVLQLVEEDPTGGEDESDSDATWASVPFYVVGEATARALRDIREIVGEYPYVPKDIRGASESGTGEKLARFILRDLGEKAKGARLLYLTGDKNRDTLPRILGEAGVTLGAIQVYETRGSSKFEADLKEAMHEVRSGGKVSELEQKALHSESTDRWWIVYFAPSDAECANPTLRNHFALSFTDAPPVASGGKPAPRIAAIGPTTGSFLRDNLAMRVDIVSPAPNPESSAQAIAGFDASHPWS